MEKIERKALAEVNDDILNALSGKFKIHPDINFEPTMEIYSRRRQQTLEEVRETASPPALQQKRRGELPIEDVRECLEIPDDAEVIRPLSSSLIQAALKALGDPEGPSFASEESGDSGYLSGSGNDATTTAASCLPTAAEAETTNANHHNDPLVLQREPAMAASTDGDDQFDKVIHDADSDSEDELDEGPSFVSDGSGTTDGTDYTWASLETQGTDHSVVLAETQAAEKSSQDAQNDSQLSATSPKSQDPETVSPNEQGEQHLLEVFDGLNNLIDESEVVYDFYGTRTVLGLTPEIVMKVGHELDIGHYSTLDYILEQQPQLPIPRVHGILRQASSKWTFVFMDRASGETLESKWEFMSNAQKAAVRDQLDALIAKYRSIPPPPSEEPNAVYGGGVPRRCKDTRRDTHEAEMPISNEDEFNDFLVTKEGWPMCDHRRLVRSYLGSNHRLRMTHADLHPRNVMITVSSQPPAAGESAKETPAGDEKVENKELPATASVAVTAILDWEMCGWYPEYWEYVKALNSLFEPLTDWAFFLPKCVGVWPLEHAVDQMLG